MDITRDKLVNVMKDGMNHMKNLFVKIPIIGTLGQVSLAAKKEATVEMIVTLLFSTLPIWLGGIVLSINYFFVKLPKNDRTLLKWVAACFDSMFSTVSNGELLMYAAATLGPTLYLGLTSFGKKVKPFTWIRPQFVLIVLIQILSSVLFFMARDKGYAGEPLFVYFTMVLYIISLLVLFPAMAFDHESKLPNPSEALNKGQATFEAGFMARKERGV